MGSVRWQGAIDFMVLAVALYFLLLWAKETRALRLAFTIIGLHAAALVARYFDLVVTSWVLDGICLGALALLVIVFQSELRHALMRLDSMLRLGLQSRDSTPQAYQEIADAMFALAERRIGALVVIPQRDSIEEMVRGGMAFGGEISKPILESIFQKTSPLHDGAAVVGPKSILQVGAVLPSTEREQVPVEFGTRHRAGMGLAERCDALVIVVSEERGSVTLMRARHILAVKNAAALVKLLEHTRANERLGWRERLRSLVMTHVKFKASAAALAAVIWGVSAIGPRATVKVVNVPLEFRNVPAGMAIEKQSANRLEVQLRGSPWLMDSMVGDGLRARFSLANSREGAVVLRVAAADINIPPGVVVEHVSPASLNIRLVRQAR